MRPIPAFWLNTDFYSLYLNIRGMQLKVSVGFLCAVIICYMISSNIRTYLVVLFVGREIAVKP